MKPDPFSPLRLDVENFDPKGMRLTCRYRGFSVGRCEGGLRLIAYSMDQCDEPMIHLAHAPPGLEFTGKVTMVTFGDVTTDNDPEVASLVITLETRVALASCTPFASHRRPCSPLEPCNDLDVDSLDSDDTDELTDWIPSFLSYADSFPDVTPNHCGPAAKGMQDNVQ